MLDPNHPINRWRTVIDFVQRGQVPPPDLAAWLVSGSQLYEARAQAGDPIGLDAAFGLGRPGRHGWWTAEARERRNALLCRLRANRFRDLDDGAAARAIVTALYSPGSDPAIRAILDIGLPRLGPKQVRRIIAIAGTNATA